MSIGDWLNAVVVGVFAAWCLRIWWKTPKPSAEDRAKVEKLAAEHPATAHLLAHLDGHWDYAPSQMVGLARQWLADHPREAAELAGTTIRVTPAGKPSYTLPIDDLRPEAEKPQWDTYKPTKPATSGRVWAEPGASGEAPLTDTRLSDPPIDPTNKPETHA